MNPGVCSGTYDWVQCDNPGVFANSMGAYLARVRKLAGGAGD